jgi:hypothetical protein
LWRSAPATPKLILRCPTSGVGCTLFCTRPGGRCNGRNADPISRHDAGWFSDPSSDYTGDPAAFTQRVTDRKSKQFACDHFCRIAPAYRRTDTQETASHEIGGAESLLRQ